MNERILITSTNTIEGAEIENYSGLISTNVVVGTNFFSDFGASITDIFGGHSATYQRKLQGIYNAALDGLKSKAETLTANAIIGLSIDFDEISGKGKSMFMISAMGTAVKVKYKIETEAKITNNNVALEYLNLEIKNRIIIKKVNLGEYPSEEEWEHIVNNPINEIFSPLLKLFKICVGKDEFEIKPKHKLVKKYFKVYLKSVDEETASDILYVDIDTKSRTSVELIKSANLFSVDSILALLNENKKSLGIKCLSADKKYYDKNDLEKMIKLLEVVSSFDETGSIEMVKQTFGKSKEKYICSEGHTNNLEDEFCVTNGCGINIKGLTKSEVSEIESFALKVECLCSIIK